MNAVIRRMTQKDIYCVKTLIDKVLRHKSILRIYTAREVAVWHQGYTRESLLRIPETTHAYVIEDVDSQNIIACGYIELKEEINTGYIGMIFTDYRYRKMGLGRRIIQALEEDEYAKQVKRFELVSTLSAYRFYQKLGFKCVNNEYRFEKKTVDGVSIYGIPMEKLNVDINV